MATNALIDRLPARQRAALAHFERAGGYALTGARGWAGGLLVLVEHDDGTEIEIDDLGCYLTDTPGRFAGAASDWPGDGV